MFVVLLLFVTSKYWMPEDLFYRLFEAKRSEDGEHLARCLCRVCLILAIFLTECGIQSAVIFCEEIQKSSICRRANTLATVQPNEVYSFQLYVVVLNTYSV